MKAWTQALAVSFCATALPCVAASPAGNTADAHRPPWKPEGELFHSYSVFRDEAVSHMRMARKRLAVVTPLLSDGDIATALFAGRVRGLETLALLDAKESRVFHSRHGYLARTQVPTWLVPLSNFRTDAISLLVIDNGVWRVSVRFDDSANKVWQSGLNARSGSRGEELTQGTVRVEASALAPDEIFGWKDVKGARFATDAPRQSAAGAKKPTSSAELAIPASVTMSENDAKKQSGSRIPRRLPRETRLQRLSRQAPEPLSPVTMGESTGSLKVPVPPPNETDVSAE